MCSSVTISFTNERRPGLSNASMPPPAGAVTENADNNAPGMQRSATTAARAWQPTSAPLPVRCSTSRVTATVFSQLPLLETSWPKKSRR
jgi:hypothetical protein